MGRGLSKLQRTILEMSYDRMTSDGREVNIYYRALVGPPTTSESPERSLLVRELKRVVPEAFERVYGDFVAWGGAWMHAGRGGEYFEAGEFLNDENGADNLTRRLQDNGLNAWFSWKIRPTYEVSKGRSPEGVYPRDVYTCELLEKFFGFEPESRSPTRHRCYIRFSESNVGEARYKAARASISRALSRLEKRGFVLQDGCGGAFLTEDGAQTARYLSVNVDYNITNINR
jgi:hypothetical protein